MINSYTPDFYHAAIKSLNAEACNIRQPAVAGKCAKVFFADIGYVTHVYRFNDEYFIRRNHKISNLLAMRNVPMPRVKTHRYMQTWFETYPYKSDKTMYEYILKSALSDQEIFTIYQELMRIEHAISSIPLADVGNIAYKFYSQIYSAKNRPQRILSKTQLINSIIFAMSRTGKMRMFHNDPTPGNILLSPDKHLSYMIDLDGVCVSNTNFALMKMLQYCPEYMWADLLHYYATISRQSQPAKLIIQAMKLLRQIKPDWQHFVTPHNISR